MESVVSPGQTPFHGPRPLPDPHLHHYQLLHRPLQYDDVVEEEEEDEGDYMDPNAPIRAGGVHFGYQTEAGGAPARYIATGPLSLTSAQSSPVPPAQVPKQNRSFVGGFFKGLKRIPRMFRGGERKRLIRRGTFGTEGTGTTTITGLTNGNTLPRYLSNPSIGPTNPQFAHRLSQAVANGSLPPGITSAAFQIRDPPVSPQHPVVTVTPPSDGAEEEQQAEFFEGPPPNEEPEFVGEAEGLEHHDVDPRERATVMVYSEAPTVTQTRHTSAPISVHQSPRTGPRVSYPAELPTRASVQAQAESFYPPAPVAGPSTTPLGSPLRQLQRRPEPPVIPVQPDPKSTLSPSAYSTMTTSTSCYDLSISSNLGPIEKFFKSLYNLPWISHGRVTVDYRPEDSPRAKGKLKSLKRPMSSWYHSIMSRSRRNSIDLLSSHSGTTSMGTSNVFSSLTSPISRHTVRSPNRHHHRSSKPRRHRSRRHRVTSASTAGIEASAATQRSASPIVPSVYPYTVPPYPPYTYPYVTYPAVAMPPTGMDTHAPPLVHSPSSARSPRGPRAARSHRRKGSSSNVKYPLGGYAPYQPLAMPPPPTIPQFASVPQAAGGMYYFAPSPPQSQNGEVEMGQTFGKTVAPVQMSPVLVHYIPAAYRQPDGGAAAHVMASPPTTPQKPSAVASNTSHK